MTIQIKRIRVTKFRSIQDTGWLDIDDVTALVGTNESGKTNLLLALWKLNPTNEEPIVPLSDYPRKEYVNYQGTYGLETFIQAEFELDYDLASSLHEETGFNISLVRNVIVSRKYNGNYSVRFSKNKIDSIEKYEIQDLCEKLISVYEESSTYEKETEGINDQIVSFFENLLGDFDDIFVLDKSHLQEMIEKIEHFLKLNFNRKKNIKAFFDEHVFMGFEDVLSAFEENGVEFPTDFTDQVLESIPQFVYYSDYGNLDSEIYLPHVIENINRDDLGQRERAKTRSLKVLFEFVRLSPDQILELGKEALPIKVVYNNQPQRTRIQDPEEEDIEVVAKKKKEREILLQSASTTLTSKFKDWWKQGNYRFRFQADGNHFRIWVSDEVRNEEIELEGRSKGLQWFFSFFLTFLVESRDTHSNCILLLDEPGLSLHPMAQIDLIRFFNSLSEENQIIYTTHSPFLVNPDNLGSVYAMYVGKNGESKISSDLRANNKVAERSIYPVHAAIGLTVSETLLYGCQPVLVEGISDQIYLQLIKSYLLKEGEYQNDRELVFIPTGGVKGMSSVIKIILGRENKKPYALLDSDKPGKDKVKQLKNGYYKDEQEKVLSIDEFLGEGKWEIEDFMPKDELARIFGKRYRSTSSDDFDDLYDDTPIIEQMELFAQENNISLSKGWKVDLAKDFQKKFEKAAKKADAKIIDQWTALFDKLTNKKSPNQ